MGFVGEAGEPDTDALDDLEMVRAMSSRQKPQNAVLAPSVVSLGHENPMVWCGCFLKGGEAVCYFLLVFLFCYILRFTIVNQLMLQLVVWMAGMSLWKGILT